MPLLNNPPRLKTTGSNWLPNPTYLFLFSARSPETGRAVYRETLRKIHANKLARFTAPLPPDQHRLLHENGSYLGRLWLITPQGKDNFQLTDTELTTALRMRLFLPTSGPPSSPGTPCPLCHDLTYWGHEDVCRGRKQYTVRQHNRILDVLAKA